MSLFPSNATDFSMIPFMRNLIDSFIFNDEIDILKFRLEAYKDLVDFTVIAESHYTFSGAKKKLRAREFLESISYDQARIIFVNYDPPQELIENALNDRWALERFARQSISDSFGNFSPEDLIIISDVDELPSPEQIEEACKLKGIHTLRTPLYHRKANWLSLQGKKWATAKLGPIKEFSDLNLLRYAQRPTITKYPGMHLSYMSKKDADIGAKAMNSAHSEHSQNLEFMNSAVLWANEFRLEHLPRFDRMHQGLLKVQSESEISNFQKAFLQQNPEFFDFSKVQYSKLHRIKASYLLHKSWENQIPVSDGQSNLALHNLAIQLVNFWKKRQARRIRLKARTLIGRENG